MLLKWLSIFNAIPTYFIYHTLTDVNIMQMIGGWVGGWVGMYVCTHVGRKLGQQHN
jgi:uncharacterized membrane protein YfcA